MINLVRVLVAFQLAQPFVHEKIHGTYFDFLKTNKAIVEVWEGQGSYVSLLALNDGFAVDVVDDDKKIILLKYNPKDENLASNLIKLANDAGVESIRPAPLRFSIEDFLQICSVANEEDKKHDHFK
jgi:hypothetical protein